MTEEQRAYQDGYQKGYELAYEEARVVIGKRFFDGNPTILQAMMRRTKQERRRRFVFGLIEAIPWLLALWWALDRAHELQTRCSDCLCITRTK